MAKRRLILALIEPKPWSDPRYFFAAPTHDQARRIAWQDLKDLCPKEWIREVSEGQKVIYTHFGSELHVIGLDKPERMEGTPWDGGIADESCDLKEGAFDRTIYPALSDRRGWAWRSGVPKRSGPSMPEYKAAFMAARKGDWKDWDAFTWYSSDILDPDVIEAAKRTLDSKTYREQYEGSWETAGGAIYDSFSEYNVRSCVYDPSLPILVGSDFNVAPMAWVLCHQRNGCLEVFDELFLFDTTTQRTLDELYRRYPNHTGGWRFYGDATGKSRHTCATDSDYTTILADPRFRKMGRSVHYPRSNPARADRYACVNALLCNAMGERRLYIDDSRCRALRNDFENVHYDPGTREAAQVGNLTHISDGLGYIVYREYPISVADDNEFEARFG